MCVHRKGTRVSPPTWYILYLYQTCVAIHILRVSQLRWYLLYMLLITLTRKRVTCMALIILFYVMCLRGTTCFLCTYKYIRLHILGERCSYAVRVRSVNFMIYVIIMYSPIGIISLVLHTVYLLSQDSLPVAIQIRGHGVHYMSCKRYSIIRVKLVNSIMLTVNVCFCLLVSYNKTISIGKVRCVRTVLVKQKNFIKANTTRAMFYNIHVYIMFFCVGVYSMYLWVIKGKVHYVYTIHVKNVNEQLCST